MSRERPLEEKVAIVTGASSGIGLAVARQLSREGAKVLIFARSRERLEEIAREDEGITAVAGDITSNDDLDELFRRCESTFGRLDILVNSAGHVEPVPLAEITPLHWRAHYAVNVDGPLECIRRAAELMRKHDGGSIVNIASISGVAGPSKFAGFAAYASSKAALIMLTEVLGAELAGSGIRINAVSPGSVDTEMLRSVAPDAVPDMTPEEVAATVVHLCLPASRPINGQNIHVYST